MAAIKEGVNQRSMNAVKSKVKGRSVDKKQENQKNKRNRENWRRQRRRQRRRRRRLHLLLTHWSSLSPTRLNSIFNSMKQSPFPFLFFLLFLVDVVDVVAVFGASITSGASGGRADARAICW